MLPVDPKRPPSKVQGIVFMMLGGCALSFGAFILAVPIGLQSNYRIFFGSMLMVYGLFRLLSGLKVVRRSIEDEDKHRASVTLDGTQPPEIKP